MAKIDMFKSLRKCLDELEDTINKLNTPPFSQPTSEEKHIIYNFNLHFADALMRDYGRDNSEKIAKIILAEIGD